MFVKWEVAFGCRVLCRAACRSCPLMWHMQVTSRAEKLVRVFFLLSFRCMCVCLFFGNSFRGACFQLDVLFAQYVKVRKRRGRGKKSTEKVGLVYFVILQVLTKENVQIVWFIVRRSDYNLITVVATFRLQHLMLEDVQRTWCDAFRHQQNLSGFRFDKMKANFLPNKINAW